MMMKMMWRYGRERPFRRDLSVNVLDLVLAAADINRCGGGAPVRCQ